jgi:heparosan-N-sulfate-glucuronate 5-epimerase
LNKPRTSRIGHAAGAAVLPVHFAHRVYGVVTSRGPGYEAQPPGRFFERDSVRGYYLDYRLKTEAKAAAHPQTLLPVTLAQLALGWSERALDGEQSAWRQFARIADILLHKAERENDWLLWPYHDVVRKYGLRGRWYDGMTQGQAASVFLRAFTQTGDPRYEEAARGAIEPLLAMDSRFVCMTSDGPVLEEGGMMPPAHILNGWVFSIWGVWDVRNDLGDARAQSLLDATIACLRINLPRYDVGWWTRYSLFPHLLPDLAKPFYHRIHIDQMDVMHRLTGFAEFEAAAERWRSYETAAHRTLALAQKLPFKLVDAVTSPAEGPVNPSQRAPRDATRS